MVLASLALTGCGSPQPASRPPKKQAKPAVAAKTQPAKTEPDRPFVAPPPLTTEPDPGLASPPQKPSTAPRTKAAPLAGLLAEAQAAEFNLPAIDERRTAAAGIRKLTGKHVTIFTDLPAGEVDELPAVFDAAVPLWCAHFGVDPARLADWRLIGHVIQAKERFAGAGLYPENLPDFPAGYSNGSQFWLYDQPSGYYRRHLMLHEGTHCFMNRWLGGAGPPWYMEGLAELLGTHRWAAGKLELAVMPRSKDDVPYWGRVKIVRDELAADRGLMLTDIMRYDAHAHLRNEPYGWCWAAAAFLDGHPATQAAFRELKGEAKDRTIDFSKRFYDRLKPQWQAISEDWQLFVLHCDYGYDFARAAIVRQPPMPLPAHRRNRHHCCRSRLAIDRLAARSGQDVHADRQRPLSGRRRPARLALRTGRHHAPLSRPQAARPVIGRHQRSRHARRHHAPRPPPADRPFRRNHSRRRRHALPLNQRSRRRPGRQRWHFAGADSGEVAGEREA